jgi:ABC-type nitrate/sulfonate/bicarbonate transport system permease component
MGNKSNAGSIPGKAGGRRNAWAADVLLRLASIGLFLLSWEVLSVLNAHFLKIFSPLLLPSFLDVLRVGAEMTKSGELFVHAFASLSRVVQGFLIAAILGIALGALVGRSRLFERLVEPVVELLRPIPPLAFLPMMVLWFGIGEASKVAFIAYAAFFPVFTTTLQGIKFVDPVLLRAAASLGATERDMFRYVILPAALPNIVTGLRIAFGLSFFVIVAAEFIAADAGLGFLINDSRTFFNVAQMLLGAIVIGLIGYTVNALLVRTEAWLLRWRKDSRTPA